MTDNDTQDPKGQSSQTTDPSKSGDGQSTQQPGNTDDLPEKFKGKSAKEIAESYLALEGKLGENAQFINKARKDLGNWEALGKVIQSNPALYSQIEFEIKKLTGQVPGQKQEDPKIRNLEGQVSDTRRATQGSIFEKFEGKYLQNLSEDKRKELQGKIGKEVVEMFDWSGDKSFDQVVEQIPLDRLPQVLEKAYKLAVGDERARLEGRLEADKNRAGMFGNMPSGNSKSEDEGLSSDEKRVAAKLGITEEKYLKQKQAMNQ